MKRRKKMKIQIIKCILKTTVYFLLFYLVILMEIISVKINIIESEESRRKSKRKRENTAEYMKNPLNN